MKELYSGTMSYRSAQAATAELLKIRELLQQIPPSEIVWDYEKRDIMPPWGNEISPEARELESYYVTSNGQHLIEVMLKVITEAERKQKDVVII